MACVECATMRHMNLLGGKKRGVRALVGVMVVVAIAAGCSSGTKDTSAGSNAPTSQAAETTVAAGPLQILVTNDDGVGAAGIDAVVQALSKLPDTKVTVVAPATNQSGTGGKTTSGPLTVTDATTASGYPAKAVAGYPADTIVWAIDDHGIDFTPDLVVSGINFGQNIGPVTDVSGTVGAARAAAARSIPALASSQGLGDPPAYPAGVTAVLAWVAAHRAALAGTPSSPVLLENLNVPTCTTGSPRAAVTVPVATDLGGRDYNKVDCTSTATNPPDDIDAFTEGFVTLSTLNPTSTTGTTQSP